MANIKKISPFPIFEDNGEKYTPLVRFNNDSFVWCLTHRGWQWNDIADFKTGEFFDKCPPQECCKLFDTVKELNEYVLNSPPEREDQPTDNV